MQSSPIVTHSKSKALRNFVKRLGTTINSCHRFIEPWLFKWGQPQRKSMKLQHVWASSLQKLAMVNNHLNIFEPFWTIWGHARCVISCETCLLKLILRCRCRFPASPVFSVRLFLSANGKLQILPLDPLCLVPLHRSNGLASRGVIPQRLVARGSSSYHVSKSLSEICALYSKKSQRPSRFQAWNPRQVGAWTQRTASQDKPMIRWCRRAMSSYLSAFAVL